MTRFALFSDLHVHSWPEHDPTLRLQECVSVIDEIREWCEENDVDTIVFGGDMFHKRGVMYTREAAWVADALQRVRSAGIEFIACAGNHDQEDRAGTIDSLQPYAAGGLLQLPDSRGYAVYAMDNCCIYTFNYCDGEDELAIRISDAQEEAVSMNCGTRIGIFHHGFAGARVGSALEYVVKEPISAEKLELSAQFDAVFSGHYHAHQLIEGMDNGWYIGAPMEHTRSDFDEEECARGFLDVHVASDGEVSWESVAIKRPRFVTWAVGREQLTEEVVAGNFIDLKYSDEEELKAAREQCIAWEARGVKAVALPQAKVSQEIRLDVNPAMSPSRVLKKYLKHTRSTVKARKLNSKDLLEVGLELIHKATGA